MTATPARARLPSIACAAERDRPRPVLISAMPAIASGASSKSASVSAKTASLIAAAGAGVIGAIALGTDEIMGGCLRGQAYGRAPLPPGPSPPLLRRTSQTPTAAWDRETAPARRPSVGIRLASPAVRRTSCASSSLLGLARVLLRPLWRQNQPPGPKRDSRTVRSRAVKLRYC